MVNLVVIRGDKVAQRTQLKDDEITDYLMAYPGCKMKCDGKPILSIWIHENTKTIGLVTLEDAPEPEKILPCGVTAQTLEVSHQEFMSVVTQSSTRFTLSPEKKSTVKMLKEILEYFPDDLLVTAVHVDGDLQHITIKGKNVVKDDKD